MKILKINYFNKNFYSKAFTLIETIVSISIVAMISALFLANYRAGERSSNFILTVQKAASDIREAQNKTLGLEEFQGSFPQGGWGVYFSTGAPGQYITFADADNEKDYDPGVEEFRIINLPSGITISNITTDPVAIVFEPPDPITYFNGTPNGTIIITFSDTNTGSTRTIDINEVGLIDVD